MEMWFSEFHTPDVKHSIRVNRQLFSRQSDYQRIDIFETPEFGRVLTLDGNVMLTERDEFIYDEMITHVPMAIHKEAKEIRWLSKHVVHTFRKMHADWMTEEYIFITKMHSVLSEDARQNMILLS